MSTVDNKRVHELTAPNVWVLFTASLKRLQVGSSRKAFIVQCSEQNMEKWALKLVGITWSPFKGIDWALFGTIGSQNKLLNKRWKGKRGNKKFSKNGLQIFISEQGAILGLKVFLILPNTKEKIARSTAGKWCICGRK